MIPTKLKKPLDQLPMVWHKVFSLLPRVMPFKLARRIYLSLVKPADDNQAYQFAMRFELFWFKPKHLIQNYIHHGVDNINRNETYILTTLHFGQFGLYPASLNLQFSFKSQYVVTGRNLTPGTDAHNFWSVYGHSPLSMAGYPCRYSTEKIFSHVQRLKTRVSQAIILDVREQGLYQQEVTLEFLGDKFYLPATVPLLAKRAGVKILPFIGFYDEETDKHQVYWFEPIEPQKDVNAVLREILINFEKIFVEHPEQYFNNLEYFRHPLPY